MISLQSKLRLLILAGLVLICLLGIGVAQAQDPSREEVIEAVKNLSNPEIIQQLESPDAAFTVEVTVYPCVEISGQETSYEQMNLIDNSTGESQQIAEQLIYCGGLGAFGLWTTRWSMDSGYFYYTDAREGTPDGFAAAWSPAVWRVAVSDLQVESLGQAQFSPNGIWIASWSQGQIQIIATNSDETMSFEQSPAELQMFEISWLPDNSGIIYIQADMLFGPVSRSTVTHIDIETGTQMVLLDK